MTEKFVSRRIDRSKDDLLMSANVEFNITAFDGASSVFSDVSESATQCFTTVTTRASEAAEGVDASSTQIATATEVSSGGFS